MSGFQDTFTRNNQENELQYDDAAAYFFFASILTIIFVPLLIHVIRHYLSKPNFDPKRIKNNERYEFNLKEFNKRKYTAFLKVKVGLTLLLGYLLVICISKGSAIKDLKSFDPYEILEIDTSATEGEIKKAYRSLAKKYHPDLNKGDPDAQSKFIILNQAYRCLTDEEVKEKCKTFGNPDGANNFQVAIALPSGLLNKKNRATILAMFFLVLLVFLPITIWIWYNDREKYDSFGVDRRSIQQTTYFMRNENILVEKVLEMVASSVEMSKINLIMRGQGESLKEMKDDAVRPVMALEACPYKKPLYMINHYMKRGRIPPVLEDDMNHIHRATPYLLASLSDFSLYLYANQMKLTPDMKPLTYNSFMNVLTFSQLYFQGMTQKMSPLFQLPGMDEGIVNRFLKKAKKEKTMTELLASSELTEKLLSCYEDPQAMQKAKHLLTLLPRVEFRVEVYVEDEGVKSYDVHAEDVMVIEIIITDLNIPEGEEAPYMRSQTYPYLKFVNWHVFMLGRNPKSGLVSIGDFKLIKGDQRVCSDKIMTRMGQPLEGEMRFLLRPDCYVGFEQDITVAFKVLPKQEKKEVFVHPEDQEACKRQTLFNQLASQLKSGDDSDEEEVDENEKIIKNEESAAGEAQAAGSDEEEEAEEQAQE